MSVSETMQVNTSPSLQMKVLRKKSFLKRHKTAGPDRLTLSCFKDDGEVITSGLTKLFELIWANEEIPKDWCE